jgi:hypothetical protein
MTAVDRNLQVHRITKEQRPIVGGTEPILRQGEAWTTVPFRADHLVETGRVFIATMRHNTTVSDDVSFRHS